MKTLLGGLLGFLAILPALSQNPIATEPEERDVTQEEAVGADHQWMVSIENVVAPNGAFKLQTNRFVQMELGLNYKDRQGNWKPSQERFVEEGGWAAAREGQHYVALYNNLRAAGSVHLEQADGKKFRSTVMGLAYTDPTTGQSALFAELKDCQGVFLSDNQVLYPDAFEGASADVRYTYFKWGFEQDIILRGIPPSPEEFGLDPKNVRLEVWTEFYEGTDPEKESKVLNLEAVAKNGEVPLVDEALSFGSMRIGLGKAFKIGEDSDPLSYVAKEWATTDDGRRFLVETVDLDAIAGAIQDLPPTKGGAGKARPESRPKLQALKRTPRFKAPDEVVSRGEWRRADRQYQVASTARRGVVVDYATMNFTTNNWTFRGNQTYYVSGLVTCNGTTTFEGGAVIKYTNTASARIEIGGTTVWPTDNQYRPIVFTAKDDNSVGETITGSTGSPSGYYADSALKWANATTSIDARNLRFVRAKAGISLNAGTGHKFRHVQFVDCESGMKPTSTDFGLHNSLFTGVTYIFNGSSSTGRVEHATVNGATAFNYNSTFASGNLKVTNSVLIGITTMGSLSATNKVAVLSSASGVFASQVAGGAHYLATGSPYRDLGVAVSSELSGDLPKMTTYSPTLISSTITSAAEFAPADSRDSGALDLGYHYSPIDFLFSANPGVTVTNAAVSFKNGVIIANDNLAAFVLTGSSSLSSVGIPDRPNVFTHYTTVQERKSSSHGSGTTRYAFYPSGNFGSGTRNINCRFTSFEGATVQKFHSIYGSDTFVSQNLSFKDCQFTFCYADLQSNATNVIPISLVNNFWNRPNYTLFGSFPHFIANQTINEGSVSILGGAVDWRDSLLLSTSIELDSGVSGTVTNRNCLFVGVTTNFTSNGTKVSCLTNSTFTFASGSLGPWYHSTTTGINQGSQTASLAGLYHYTVKTDQSKETNSTVDIGFHYVATSSGSPIDTDGDGVPDYLEDANGNGTLDSGETSISSATDLGFKVIITEPKAGQNLP